jgi:hypothetical protein
MKTAEEILNLEIEKLHPGSQPCFTGFEGIYDGTADLILAAMKAYAEQERKKAFRAGEQCHALRGALQGRDSKEGYSDYADKNPLV